MGLKQAGAEFAIYLIASQAINTPTIGKFDTKNGLQMPFYPFQAVVRTEGAA
jgi:hypothetical protein